MRIAVRSVCAAIAFSLVAVSAFGLSAVACDSGDPATTTARGGSVSTTAGLAPTNTSGSAAAGGATTDSFSGADSATTDSFSGADSATTDSSVGDDTDTDIGSLDTASPPTTSVEASVRVEAEAQLGDWKIKVVGVTAPATELLLNHNEFNEPPQPGFDFVLVELEVTYLGTESGTFANEVVATFVGGNGGEFAGPQGRMDSPQPLDEAGEAGPGESVSGDLVLEVPAGEFAGGSVRFALAAYPEQTVSFPLAG